jgi:hypothetical protein
MSSRPPRPPLRTALMVGVFVLLGTALSCGSVIAFFEIVGNNPEVQARVRGTATAEVMILLTAQAQLNRDVARLDAAEVVLEETFDGPGTALAFDPAGLSDGTYKAYYALTGFQFMPWTEPLADFAAEVDCKIAGANGACGIFFGGQPRAEGDGYDHHAFYATGAGYGYETVAPAGQTTTATGTTPAHLGSDWNHVRVVRLGDQVWYTLNTEEVEHLTLAEPALASGAIGLIGGLLGGGDAGAAADVAFDNFVLRRIP